MQILLAKGVSKLAPVDPTQIRNLYIVWIPALTRILLYKKLKLTQQIITMCVLNNAHFHTMPTRQQKAALRFAPILIITAFRIICVKCVPQFAHLAQHLMSAPVALAPAT